MKLSVLFKPRRFAVWVVLPVLLLAVVIASV